MTRPDVLALAREALGDREPTGELLRLLVAHPPEGVTPAEWWDALDAVTRRDREGAP